MHPSTVGRRFMSVATQAVKFSRFGNPSAVLSLGAGTVDDALAGNTVLVKMLAASISPTDLGQVKGFGGAGKPGVAGNEGVGVVVKVGPSVKGLAVSDLVVPVKAGLGTWSTHAVAAEDALAKIPGSADKFPVEAAALAAPSAAIRLLDSFVDLKKGDVIIQNNAGSTVGQAVVIYAASKGIKTINILRKRNDWDDYVNHLQGLGAGLVVNEDFARTPAFAKLVADLPKAKLALSSVADSAATLAHNLAEGGTLVTYGNVSSKAQHLPLEPLLLNDITIKGFNLQKYLAGASPADRAKLISAALGIANKLLLATEPFADFSHALKRSQEAGERKIVLKF